MSQYVALSSFIANCFRYLWVSKMKPICIPQIFYEDSEFINHYRQKTSLICFFLFETSKSWNCWPFYPTGAMSRIHTFEKPQCDRCQHRSAVKKYAAPLHFIPSPHPSPPPYPPPQRQLPRANDIGPLDPVTSSANGVASLAHSIGNPFSSATPSCPVPAKPALPVEKKGSHSRQG